MLFSFIIGVVVGANFGLFLFSVLIANKNK